MKHASQEELILLYYREPGVDEETRVHVEQCGECRAAAEALAHTLDLCDDWAVPEPTPDYGRTVWNSLVSSLHVERKRRLYQWNPAFALAVATALLLAAYFAGRASRHPEPSVLTGLSTEARDRILAISVADHLDRAEILLTEISNASDADRTGVEAERNRAQDLVEEGRLIRQTLARGDSAPTVPLLEEVDRLMLEVANSPEQVGAAQIHLWQERIASQSLLFKVRVAESNLRREGTGS